MKEMQIAKLMKHKWEEELISGIGRGYDGTFAIFFYGCTMRCVYCQNSKISRSNNVGTKVEVEANKIGAETNKVNVTVLAPTENKMYIGINEARNGANEVSVRVNGTGVGANICRRGGYYPPAYKGELHEPAKINYTPEELSDEIIKSQSDNVASVSFITGAQYVNQIVETIKLAKKKGLKIPVVYNSSGYETASQIKKLDGLVDIYLPDFKYFDNKLGKKYSGVPNYVDVAKACISEMHRQIKSLRRGEPELRLCNSRVQNRRGELCEPSLIVRHLVLPANTENSKRVIKYLYDTYGDDIYLSIMSQYTPMPHNEDINKFPELLRKVTKREYEKVVDYAISLGIKNAYVQGEDVADESFIPEFR